MDYISAMDRVCDEEFDRVIYILNHIFFRNKRVGKIIQFLRRFR